MRRHFSTTAVFLLALAIGLTGANRSPAAKALAAANDAWERGDYISALNGYIDLLDLLEFENHELITETSKTTVATLMLLASSPSRIRDVKVEPAAGGAATVTWSPSPEKDVTSYIVSYRPASGSITRRLTVTAPRAKLASVTPGTVISVKALNARGLEGWDWARVPLQ